MSTTAAIVRRSREAAGWAGWLGAAAAAGAEEA